MQQRASAQEGERQASEAGQREVIAFLSEPATHGGAAVERVDTHISRIFLAGDRAWKLKRALRTNYLDFSTLDRREQSCRRELEVNRAAGGIYIGVTPVVRRDGRLRLGGPGAPIEWLVEMRRFDRSRELDRLCESGTLTLPIIERLADEVAALHRAAPETPGFGDAEDLRARIDQIAGALAEAAGGSDLAAGAETWRSAAQAARQAQADLIERRARLGRVRRCHGDLHLGNVVMLGDRPTPFDAIEFNEAIASIDVLYDLALTLSDLIMRGRADLANGLLNRYLGATRDYGGLAADAALSLHARRGAGDDGGVARSGRGGGAGLRLRDGGSAAGTGAATGRDRRRVGNRQVDARARSRAAARATARRDRHPLGRGAEATVRGAAGGRGCRWRPTRRRWTARCWRGWRSMRGWRCGPGRPWCSMQRFSIRGGACLRGGDCHAAGVRFDGIWLRAAAEEAMERVSARAADASDATAARGQASGRARGAPSRLAATPGRAAARGDRRRGRKYARESQLAGLRGGSAGRE